jgi:hypothetical protein
MLVIYTSNIQGPKSYLLLNNLSNIMVVCPRKNMICLIFLVTMAVVLDAYILMPPAAAFGSRKASALHQVTSSSYYEPAALQHDESLSSQVLKNGAEDTSMHVLQPPWVQQYMEVLRGRDFHDLHDLGIHSPEDHGLDIATTLITASWLKLTLIDSWEDQWFTSLSIVQLTTNTCLTLLRCKLSL